jgi:thymidylate synthase
MIVNVPSQVDWVINHYKEKGFYNNHCYIQVGYPESSFAYDIPYTNPNERQTSPCLRGIDTKIINIDGKDYLMADVNFRSWDMYSAFPTNMGGIVLLMEYIAGMLGIEVGALGFNCIKLHVYSYDIVNLEGRLNR